MRPLFKRTPTGPGWMTNPTIAPTWAQYSTASKDGALAHSAVWAACRLRADLISSLPVDVYRKVGPIQVEVPTPTKLDKPGSVYIDEYLYSSQMDLDRFGNSMGRIVATDALGLPAVVELWPADQVTVKWTPGSPPTYRYRNVDYTADQVWHERQYTVAGLPIGLSPVAYAAMTISQYVSAQEFALDWYSGVALPSGLVKNTKRDLVPGESETVKKRWRASVRAGEPMVVDSQWEFTPLAGASNDQSWLSTMDSSAVQVARFFGVPSDLIDAAQAGSSVTYANITQRNLQFLIMNLGPAITRREKALSRWLPRPQFVKLNTDALLRMDPDTASGMLGQQIRDRMLAPSEARQLQNRAPFTDDQMAEFDRLFTVRRETAVATPVQITKGSAG